MTALPPTPNLTPERALLVLCGLALSLTLAAIMLATLGGVS